MRGRLDAGDVLSTPDAGHGISGMGFWFWFGGWEAEVRTVGASLMDGWFGWEVEGLEGLGMPFVVGILDGFFAGLGGVRLGVG